MPIFANMYGFHLTSEKQTVILQEEKNEQYKLKLKDIVSLALQLTVSSTTNCATERDHAELCLREPNFILVLAHAQRYRVYNTSFRRRGVVCYNDYQLR